MSQIPQPERKPGISKKKIAAMVITAAAIALVFIIPATRKGIFKVIEMLGGADVEAVKEFIRSYGALAIAVSMGLMILQSIAAPIPAFLITFANAAVFGWLKGAAISWTGAMLGAAICFGLSRLFGRDVVVKITGKGVLQSLDKFFVSNGAKSIFIARLLPFVPFDPISYAAGLTGMGFVPFLVATGLGQLPATIIYSYAGSTLLSGNVKLFMYGLSAIFAAGALSLILKNIFDQRKAKKAENQEV
ncbi:MAG: TVP38/TMEM64 family protein [Lachnospiraceae bacterium]|nr:TVP38/TMEM64 family protein [Lachnospiraceae bacterium]